MKIIEYKIKILNWFGKLADCISCSPRNRADHKLWSFKGISIDLLYLMLKEKYSWREGDWKYSFMPCWILYHSLWVQSHILKWLSTYESCQECLYHGWYEFFWKNTCYFFKLEFIFITHCCLDQCAMLRCEMCWSYSKFPIPSPPPPKNPRAPAPGQIKRWYSKW